MKLELNSGDIIAVGRTKVTVKEIMYQDIYIRDGILNYVDVEFKDTNGNYRHPKMSADPDPTGYYDKGYLIIGGNEYHMGDKVE